MAMDSILGSFAQLHCSVARFRDANPNMLMEPRRCSSRGVTSGDCKLLPEK